MIIESHKGEFECHSWTELENFIKESALNPFDDIWIRREHAYPCLAILVNGEFACVHYFLNDNGDMWQSVGSGDEDVTFICGGEESELPADAVISIREAIECAKEFYESPQRPRCTEWRDL